MSNLRPGGENGGIKPFLFETLLWLGRQRRAPLVFLYLTCAQTHSEVRSELARLEDEVICVRRDGPLPLGDQDQPRERLAVPPPPDLLWRLRADVLYCPFGHAEFASPGIGTICTVVDILHQDFPWTLRPHENEQRERMFQEIVAVADRLQCISHHVVSRLEAHYGVPAERMFVTYIAVHHRFVSQLPAEASAESGGEFVKIPPFFFFPANSWKHKNHETLLLAYGIYRDRSLADGVEPWPLLLTGHEDDRWRELQDLAATLGLLGEGAVQFRGYVPPREFAALWRSAGALVFPSLHEGFGIPLLEAMQHDLAVLTNREGSLPEVGGEACLYADARRPQSLADAMTRVAADAGLRAELVTKGRKRLEDFSLTRESNHLLDAILKLVGSREAHRSRCKGIFADGWMERWALLALPDPVLVGTQRGRLILRFHALPAPRRLRLRAATASALGTFDLPAGQPGYEISVDFLPAGGALHLEVLNAANLAWSDPRIHGVHLETAVIRRSTGEEYSLFPVP